MLRVTEYTASFLNPLWSKSALLPDIKRELGIEFTGEGWYEVNGMLYLIVPQVDITLSVDGPYAYHAWDEDPRPAIQKMVEMPNKSPAALPEGIAAAWPKLLAASAEIKTWAESIELEVSISLLPESPPALVDPENIGREDGRASYRFDKFNVQVLTRQQIGNIRSTPNEMPPYVRVIHEGDVGIAVYLNVI